MIDDQTNLFWTGGWDSTFRLLQLLLIKEKKVKPYYLIDHSRNSTDIEIQTMRKIKKHLYHCYPRTKELLLQTEFVDINELEPDKDILSSWNQIKKDRHIGAQYKLFACFCKQFAITGLELSIQKHINENSIESSLAFNLDEERITDNEYTIFKYFSFPLIELSKQDMQRIAGKQNWTPVLEMTWFCHRPIRIPLYGAAPCGGCNPCVVAIEEGFGWRVPMYSRLLGRVAKKIYHSSTIQKLRSMAY